MNFTDAVATMVKSRSGDATDSEKWDAITTIVAAVEPMCKNDTDGIGDWIAGGEYTGNETIESIAMEWDGAKYAFTYEEINPDDIVSIGLKEAMGSYANYKAYKITINGRSEQAEALHLTAKEKIGIAWGADDEWADIFSSESVEKLIDMWLNAPEEWASRN